MTRLLVKWFVRHPEDTASAEGRGRFGLLGSVTGMVCNLILFLLKLAGGLFSGSVSILADAFNNLSDMGSSLVTLVGFCLAAKPADPEHPFGHGRFEYITGFTVGIVILYVGLELLRSSVDKLIHPTETTFHIATVAVLVVSMMMKLWLYFFYRHLSRCIDSASLKASAMDSFSDMASTGAVLLGFWFSHLWSVNLDGILGLLVAGLILYSGIGVIRDTLGPLLGQPPSAEFIDAVCAHVLSYDGVVGIHDLVVHDYGPGRQFVSVHAEVPANVDIQISHDIIDRCERDAAEKLGLEMVVHLDPIVTDDETLQQAREETAEAVCSIHPDLSIHDFRMVEGNTHTNLIFDLVLPAGFALSDSECIEKVQQAVKQHHPEYCCVINIDRNYVMSQPHSKGRN